MLGDEQTSFVIKTGDELSAIRSSLLIAAQTGDRTGLRHAGPRLSRIVNVSSLGGNLEIAAMAGECVEAIDAFVKAKDADLSLANRALDSLARVEAALLNITLLSDTDAAVAGELSIDEAFDFILQQEREPEPVPDGEEFPIDEETLEIFRSEADDLLASISRSLTELASASDDKHSLWEIRRHIHTLKGSAGIVGLHQIASLAHHAEDLLDHLVSKGSPANAKVLEFLRKTTEHIGNILSGDGTLQGREDAPSVANNLRIGREQTSQEPTSHTSRSVNSVPPTPPVVRVSVSRIDEIMRLATRLSGLSHSLRRRISTDSALAGDKRIEKLLGSQSELIAELSQKLLDIRMVRFGNLETRLVRNINSTCSDEGKKAVLDLRDPDVEIDTLTIDALIEPMLHLIKNAVVHGIETPETRRLIGKSETGTITVTVGYDNDMVVVGIADDGGGLSTSRILEQALGSGLIDAADAEKMSEAEINQLIFSRGLTTAEKLDMNAGRGVGMSIVKESIESRGGTIRVETVPQKGTKFTLTMPARVGTAPSIDDDAEARTAEDSPMVLIVDDSAAIRHQTAKFAAAAGCRAITAIDGAEALEILLSGTHEPDLILSDVEMPNMNGWELLEYIKTDDNLGHIPVVMITSLDDAEYRQKAKDLGAAGYIVKPATAEKIAGCIERTLAVA
jgi:CheY-like chemotaxis protein/HPt (histidine-containing phosphotransfer) domain-containing protein